jgi:hypothetical protein
MTNAKTINNKVMADYVIYPSDPKKEKVIRGLYMYMEGMREIYLQQPQYFQTLLNKIKSTGKTGVVVTNFLSHYAICKSLFNSKLAALCPEKPAGTDFSSSIALELMNYNGEIQYQPLMSLYYNNCVNFALNDIDLGLGMRLALGNDAPAEGSPNGQANGNSDLIPCWHFKKNGQIQLELISEQQAKNSKIPLFIMNPGLIKNGTSPYVSPEGYVFTMVDVNDGDGGIYVPTIVNGGCNTGGSSGPSQGSGGNSGGGNSPGSQIGPHAVYFEGMNIAYHYDASGASEVKTFVGNPGAGYFVTLGQVPANVVNCNCFTDISKVIYTTTTENNDLLWCVYEHDWWIINGKTFLIPSCYNPSFKSTSIMFGSFVDETYSRFHCRPIDVGLGDNNIGSLGYAYYSHFYGINHFDVHRD